MPGSHARIDLTPELAAQRTTIAKQKHDYAVRSHAKNRVVGNEPNLDRDVHGCGAELAVSIYTGLPWNGKHARHRADVGENVQVRCRILKEGSTVPWTDYLLYVHESDDDDQPVVMVMPVAKDSYLLIGWCFIADVKQLGREDKRLGDGSRSWALKQDKLYPMQTLAGVAR